MNLSININDTKNRYIILYSIIFSSNLISPSKKNYGISMGISWLCPKKFFSSNLSLKMVESHFKFGKNYLIMPQSKNVIIIMRNINR